MESSLVAVKILQIAYLYSTAVGCLTFTAGVIGNTVNILVFLRVAHFRHHRSIFYLIIESISDFLYQFFSITITVFISLYGNDLTNRVLVWCRLKYFFAQSFGLITFSMICFQAADQFFSTNYRCVLRQIFTYTLAQYTAFGTVCIWLLHSLACSFYVSIIPSIGCIISNSTWIHYVTYVFYPVLVGFLPITIASVFSLLAYRNVRRIIRRQVPIERRRFDQQITAMILLRVICFIIFTLPYITFRIYIVNVPVEQTDLVHYALSQLVQVIIVSIVNLNYAANFYIFFVSSARYRRQVKYVLTKKCWRKWFNWNMKSVHPDNLINYPSNVGME
ncbi:unnamed protein product [Adineta ricciae]|uniref:G-protein coupled receptors family 1 profile domain-containing protein n=1 Tax=Adineta ricciae TaxID=249248 RepID=A0A814FN17_ADIRI|nr:unnamed protein product [Adineta ricciae]CAF1280024.1 unnamed protein product [Adineta ricciae]